MRVAVALSMLVFALAAAADARVSFSGPSHFGAGDLPTDVVVGDFNGDSDPDLAVSNHFSDDVSVLVGGAGGIFAAAPGSPLSVGDGPGTIRIGDINGDADPDLAVVNLNLHQIRILLGGSGASFTAAPIVSTGSRPFDVALADFDGDGNTDMAVTQAQLPRLSIFLGDGTGKFTKSTDIGGGSPYAVVAGRFNADDDVDLAVTNIFQDTVSILLGGTGATFTASGSLTTGDEPVAIVATRLDVDGEQLSAAVDSGPEHGDVDLAADGSLRYTPDPDFAGVDSFTYRAGDGITGSDPATVTIDVAAVDDVSQAPGEAFATDEDVALTVAAPGVLGNDSDVDGDALSAALVDGPGHGRLVLEDDGSFVYSPDPDFNGSDSFRYRAGDSPPATVTIDVAAVDDPAAGDLPAAASVAAPLTLRRLSVRGRKRLRLAFVLSDAATVQLTVTHRRGGRRVSVRRSFGAGPRRVVIRRALAPGRYAVRAVATSADGRRSAPARVAFRVSRRHRIV